MGALIALTALLACISLYIFYAFTPKYANKSQVSVFNWLIVAITFMVCASVSWNLSVTYGETENPARVKAVMFCISAAIVSGFFFVGFILRNFWIFKPASRRRL